MSACMRCLYSSDQRAFGLTGLLAGTGTGVFASTAALRAPALSFSVARAGGGMDEEFESFMTFTVPNTLRLRQQSRSRNRVGAAPTRWPLARRTRHSLAATNVSVYLC